MARARTTPEPVEDNNAPAVTPEAVSISDQAGESSTTPPESGLSSGEGAAGNTQNLSAGESSVNINELSGNPEGSDAGQLLSSPDLLIPGYSAPISENTSTDGVADAPPADVAESVSADATALIDLTDTAQVNPNPAIVQIYPMRSYMDENELRRRGGPAYSAPRRHAEDLVQRKLASFDPLKE